jgi:hypothetical protein
MGNGFGRCLEARSLVDFDPLSARLSQTDGMATNRPGDTTGEPDSHQDAPVEKTYRAWFGPLSQTEAMSPSLRKGPRCCVAARLRECQQRTSYCARTTSAVIAKFQVRPRGGPDFPRMGDATLFSKSCRRPRWAMARFGTRCCAGTYSQQYALCKTQ